jgi:hypothetical protein
VRRRGAYRDDTGGIYDALDLSDVEIRNTNSLYLKQQRESELQHPGTAHKQCTLPVSSSLIMAFQVSTRGVSVSRCTSSSDLSGERPLPGTKAAGQWITAIALFINEYSLTVDVLTVKIKVGQAELLESLVKLGFNNLRLMGRVP